MLEDEEHKKVRSVFDVYTVIHGKMDACDTLSAIRGLNLNPTIALVQSLGGADKRGEKLLTFEDFYNIYERVRDNKEQGGFVDFVECLKIYDVGENGRMKLVDLTNMLLCLGERITEDQLNEVFRDCKLEEEDDEGWFPYLPFLCRLCEKPVPSDWTPAL